MAPNLCAFQVQKGNIEICLLDHKVVPVVVILVDQSALGLQGGSFQLNECLYIVCLVSPLLAAQTCVAQVKSMCDYRTDVNSSLE